MKVKLMAKLLMLASAAFCVTSVGVQAQEHPEEIARAVTVHGIVESIDYASGTIELKDAHGRPRTIYTTPSTTIIGSRETGYQELGDIRPGAHVTVEASRMDSQLDATLVRIHEAR